MKEPGIIVNMKEPGNRPGIILSMLSMKEPGISIDRESSRESVLSMLSMKEPGISTQKGESVLSILSLKQPGIILSVLSRKSRESVLSRKSRESVLSRKSHNGKP
ncbi:hypothetical protein DPMN_061737 [Dreissena polymorpha]|uniref:Uncharacterized protein n=1 Tax=Dreissena polymorpha TaxID=45954 RepID=A0A9D4HJG2_DREPO|nr:hypothetical protein DPMN_061737 [Dreissena polymorpha]